MGDRVSVVPQWLGICLPVQATRFNPRTGKIPRAVRQLSPCATASEARTNERPCSAANKAVAVRSPGITTIENCLHWLQPKKKRKRNGVYRKAYVSRSPVGHCSVSVSPSVLNIWNPRKMVTHPNTVNVKQTFLGKHSWKKHVNFSTRKEWLDKASLTIHLMRVVSAYLNIAPHTGFPLCYFELSYLYVFPSAIDGLLNPFSFVSLMFCWFPFLCIFSTFQKGTKDMSWYLLTSQGRKILDASTRLNWYHLWLLVFIFSGKCCRQICQWALIIVFHSYPSKESTCNLGYLGFVPELGRSPDGNGNRVQPVSLPRESHGQRSLAGYSSWGHKESYTTEQLTCPSKACMLHPKVDLESYLRVCKCMPRC